MLEGEFWFLFDDYVMYYFLFGVFFCKWWVIECVFWLKELLGDYLLLMDEKIVVEGGLLMYYNFFYVDIYMSVVFFY